MIVISRCEEIDGVSGLGLGVRKMFSSHFCSLDTT